MVGPVGVCLFVVAGTGIEVRLELGLVVVSAADTVDSEETCC